VNNVVVSYFGDVSNYPIDGLVTSTFDDYLSYYGCSTLSLVLLNDVSIIIS
jgi:hypothetical protein